MTANPGTENRYMSVATCAVYIGRTETALYVMVRRKQIPHSKVHGRLVFDKDRIDRWMERHTKRGKVETG